MAPRAASSSIRLSIPSAAAEWSAVSPALLAVFTSFCRSLPTLTELMMVLPVVPGLTVATSVNVKPSNPLWVNEFVVGYHRAVHLGAALVLMGAIISVLTVRQLPRREGAAESVVGALANEP